MVTLIIIMALETTSVSKIRLGKSYVVTSKPPTPQRGQLPVPLLTEFQLTQIIMLLLLFALMKGCLGKINFKKVWPLAQKTLNLQEGTHFTPFVHKGCLIG
jgi:hypothetical protein